MQVYTAQAYAQPSSVPSVSAEHAHRCADALATYMGENPSQFSTEFQLAFQRNVMNPISHILIGSGKGPQQ